MFQENVSVTTETKAAYEGRLFPRLRRVFDFTRSAWCICGISLLYIVVIDLGLSLYFSIAEPKFGVSHTEIQVDLSTLESAYGNPPWLKGFYRDFDQQRMRWTPNVYWTAAPHRGTYFNVDSRGLRATLPGRRSPCKRPVKIFTFGGSAMFGYEVRDDYTIASWLQKFLDSSTYCTEVSNFGQEAYVSTQEMLALFAELRGGNRPDIVIFYDGWNDVDSTNRNGLAGLTVGEEARRREFEITNAVFPRDRRRLYTAAATIFLLHTGLGEAAKHIVQALFPKRFVEVRGQLVRIGATIPEKTPLADPERTAQDVVRVYLSNKELIESAAEKYGFRCLFYWQPCLLTKRALAPLEKRQMEDYYGKALGDAGTELFRDVYAEIELDGRQDGIIDLSDLFRGSTRLYYFDEVHLIEDGNRRVAQRLLPDILTLLSERSAGEWRGASLNASGYPSTQLHDPRTRATKS